MVLLKKSAFYLVYGQFYPIFSPRQHQKISKRSADLAVVPYGRRRVLVRVSVRV